MTRTAPSISVIGRGQTRVPPDRIVFTFEIEALLPTVEETEQQLASLRRQLAAALATVGIDRRQVHSGGPQLRPHHEREEHRWVFKGVHGSERLTVRCPYELGRSTGVLRALGDEVAHIRVNVDHVARDTTAARATALQAAVADARRQAEIIAAASGVSLGEVLDLSREGETGGYSRATSVLCEAAPEETGEFHAQEIIVAVEVKAVWALRASERS